MQIKGIAGGPNRDALAADLQQFLKEQFQADVQREQRSDQQAKRDGGTLAVISLIIALPGAVNQLIALAERAKLKQRLDALLTRIRDAAGPDDVATLQVDEGRQVDLKTATSDEVLEALEHTGQR